MGLGVGYLHLKDIGEPDRGGGGEGLGGWGGRGWCGSHRKSRYRDLSGVKGGGGGGVGWYLVSQSGVAAQRFGMISD